jgi:hypothetical protein
VQSGCRRCENRVKVGLVKGAVIWTLLARNRIRAVVSAQAVSHGGVHWGTRWPATPTIESAGYWHAEVKVAELKFWLPRKTVCGCEVSQFSVVLNDVRVGS